MRCFSFGYSSSFDKKKQYVQSMLQVDPLGFANRWKHGGECGVEVSSVNRGIFPASSLCAELRFTLRGVGQQGSPACLLKHATTTRFFLTSSTNLCALHFVSSLSQ